MEKFVTYSGLVAPLDRENVDTDMIIPKQFMKSITGFGPNAFDHLRYLDEGQPDQDNSKRPLNPDFVLNKPRYRAFDPALAQKFRHRKLARARPQGIAAIRLSGADRAKLRGHLLQQLP